MFDNLPFWQYAVIALALTQMSTLSVTIYLHRYLTHGSLKLHPFATTCFRFNVWLMTGTWPDEWRAIHRWHHDQVDTELDPHSPWHFGIRRVLFGMYFLYVRAKRRPDLFAVYGKPTPQDWLERNLYARWTWLGLVLMLPVQILLFGPVAGSCIWVFQVLWMPAVAGIINGLGHYWGYRNFKTPDKSRNIWLLGSPIPIIGGEEFHNNHHAMMGSAKLSLRWWEFDSGWLVIRILEMLGFATEVRRS